VRAFSRPNGRAYELNSWYAWLYLSDLLGEVRVFVFDIRTGTQYTVLLTRYAMHCYSAGVCTREGRRRLKSTLSNLFMNISRGSDILGKVLNPSDSRASQPCLTGLHCPGVTGVQQSCISRESRVFGESVRTCASPDALQHKLAYRPI